MFGRHSVLVVSLLALSAGLRAHGGQTKAGDALPSVQQILDTYVEAIGGRAAVQAATSSVMKGTIDVPSIGAKGTLIIWAKAPNKLLTEIASAMLGNSRLGFDGTRAWKEEQGAITDLPRFAQREADFYLPIKLLELFPRIELKGKERISDRDAYRLEAPRGGNPKRWYFDTESGFMIRTEVRDAEAALLNREDYEEYRSVDGIRVPFRLRRLDTGEIEVVVSFTEVKFNVTVDDAIFARPAK